MSIRGQEQLGELAARFRAAGQAGKREGLEAAAGVVRDALEETLGEHVRTGNALATSSVTAGGDAIVIEHPDYMRFVDGFTFADGPPAEVLDAAGDELVRGIVERLS